MQSTVPEYVETDGEALSTDNGKIQQQFFASSDVTPSQRLSDESLRRPTKMVLLQANLNSHQEDGHTPLTKALMAQDTTKAQLLLEHGADSNLTIPTGETPLYLVACQGFLPGVILLLEHRADPNRPTLDGETPLYGAAINGHDACLECLLEKGANADAATKNEGETPLYGAASNGHSLCLKQLIERGADINKPNDKGVTPLMGAAKKTQGKYVESLLDTTEDPLRGETADDARHVSHAPSNGYEECVWLLIERQCTIAEDIDSDQTPLVWAARSGNCSWVEIFLEKGADPDKDAPNGDTALFWAAESGHETCVRLLLRYKANVNLATGNGETPLFAAARTGNDVLVDILLEYGADPNGVSTEIVNPSMLSSSRHGDPEQKVVVYTLRHASTPDYTGLLAKQTPLYVAAKLGHTECVKVLLSYNADPDLFTERDSEDPNCGVAARDTPLIAAVSRRHADCVEALLDKAIPEAVTRSGKIPLKIALELRDEEIVELLLSGDKVNNVHFFQNHEFIKRLFKECKTSFILDLLASDGLPWAAKQCLLEIALKNTKDENMILQFIFVALGDLSAKSIEHQTIFLLMMDFYFYSAWISTFGFAAFHALSEETERRTTGSILAMLFLTLYFIARELIELRRSGKRYVKDVWNWVDQGAIVLVMVTGIRFLTGAELVNDGEVTNSFQRAIMSTGALLMLSFVGYLKTTFLPFSNFVGGVMQVSHF
jgi:ankyrin repeat protein